MTPQNKTEKKCMELTMLGTGNALVTKCYNTCYVINGDGGSILVDGGGGNALFPQLEKAGIDWMDLRDIFVTHKHLDHIMGIIWMIRMICQHMKQGEYEGEASIYAHDEVIDILRSAAGRLLPEKHVRFMDDRLHMVTLRDGETRTIAGREFTFFDIHSTKAKQYGYCLDLGEGRKLTCCGDEPCGDSCRGLAKDSDWLLHEAFCLDGEADIFHPYEKHHSTVKDACELAEELRIKDLLLYHTEDTHLPERKELYLAEGRRYFHGNIHIPDDLEKIVIPG